MSLTDQPAWLSVMIFWARSRGSIGVDHARERCLAGASWSSRGGGVGLLGGPGPVDLGVVVDGDGREQLAGDMFGPSAMALIAAARTRRQAADASAGALVKIPGLFREHARLVAVSPSADSIEAMMDRHSDW